MELFRLLGTIAIENSDAMEAIDETTENAEDSSNKMVKAFKKIGAAVVAAFAVDKILDFGKACLDTAAELQATESQFTQVFGDLESSASESLSEVARQAGIVENRMKGSFTKIAAFAKTTGMETDDALALTERAMIAVADSAAFYDRSLEETTESLQSFLKGNYENDSALGLSCTETTRNAAANKLYGKSFQELSEAQKQLTLLQMVEDANAASGALGQAARESDTWTNQVGNLKQAWKDFEAIIGATFLPVMIGFIKSLSDKVQAANEKIVAFNQWCSENETLVAVLSVALATLAGAVAAYNIVINAATIATTLHTTATTIATAATSAFGAVLAFITSPITLVIAAIGALVAAGVALYKNWDTVKNFANSLWEGLKNTFGKIKETITDIMTKAADTVKGAIEKIKGFFKFDWSFPKLKMPHFKISGSFSLDPPSVPSLGVEWYAKGGVLHEPTIFGMNGSKAMVGGESGPEAVAPIETLQQYIRDAVRANDTTLLNAINSGFDKLSELLLTYLPGIANMKLVTDTGALVGELAPRMDEALGILAQRDERGIG